MIFETIISSINISGEAHVTPFGIRIQDEYIVISPYKPSTTLQNILATEYAVLNVCDDVRVFAGALTGRSPWQLLQADEVPGYRLANALGHQELKLVKVEEDLVRPQLFLKVLHEAQHQPFKGFNRAQAAVIELAVLVSRLKRLPMEKIKHEIAYLQIAIDKTAGEREQQAWNWLMEAVNNHEAMLNNQNLA